LRVPLPHKPSRARLQAAEGGHRKKSVVSKPALKARVYKGLAGANVTFCGEGGATERCEKSPVRKAVGGL